MRSLRLGVLVSLLLTATTLAGVVACGVGSTIEDLFGPVGDGVPGSKIDQQVPDNAVGPSQPNKMQDAREKTGAGGAAQGADAAIGSDVTVPLPDSAEPKPPGAGGNASDGSSSHGSGPGSDDAAGPGLSDAGVPKQADCRNACDSDCTHGSESRACRTCVDSTCATLLVDFEHAPARAEYSKCAQPCKTIECFNDCCSRFPQACLATHAYGGCYCGYNKPSCKDSCLSACTGVNLDLSCTDCLQESPCAGGLYTYTYAAGRELFQACRQSCGPDAACQKQCCTKHPEPCAARQNLVACACL